MNMNERINETLNDLTRINHDRAEGYLKVIRQLPASDGDLKYLFKQFVFESNSYADTLTAYILKNGGKPASGTTTAGKIYRMWMQVRLDGSAAERNSVLAWCEFGEDAAQRAYKAALEADVNMPAEITELIISQKLALKSAYDEIKHYRDLQATER